MEIDQNQKVNESVEVENDFQLINEDFPQEGSELCDEKLWKARTGLDEDSLCAAIETIIFMSDKPLSLNKIKGVVDEDIPLRLIHSSIERLQSEYETKQHGIRLLEVAEGYQFRTKPTYSKYVQDLFKVNALTLSPTALEVLSIVAYKQPISRSYIDKVRGVDSSHIIRALMDKRLVKVVGRSNDMGKPTVYGTTQEFLEVFSLASLGDLPPEFEIETMAKNSLGQVGDIKEAVSGLDKNRFQFDESEELEALSKSISSIMVDTAFTKSLKVEDKKRVDESGQTKKSAFELLEEFILKKEIIDQNREALESNLFMIGEEDPKVVSDLLSQIHNEPLKEDGFQMVDLDTGEEIIPDLPQDILEAIDQFDGNEAQQDQDESEGLTALENQINQVQKDLEEKATEHDLDLSFLSEQQEDQDASNESTLE